MSLLEVKSLVSVFRSPLGDIRAVDDVDLSIEAGEVVCLVGESGCGKSAFANSVMGLMPEGKKAHPQGSILFQGTDLLQQEDKQWRRIRGLQIGMIFQEPMTSLNPVMRIERQVAEPLLIHKICNADAARDKAIRALGDVGIPEPERVAKQYPHELSGGMRQRVMIAMASIAEPALLIADEPTTALDVTIESQILQLLKDMQQRTGMAMLFITHDLGIVAQIADRVCVMYAGQIVESGPVQSVFETPAHPYTEGLLASMPRRGVRHERMPTISGTVPPPLARPSGCRFEPRCRYADANCLDPVSIRQAPHSPAQVRCIYPDAVQKRAAS